jgi:hypothetical protein
VIIVRSADETGKRLAAHNDTNHLWCQVADFLHLQQPHFWFRDARAARCARSLFGTFLT